MSKQSINFFLNFPNEILSLGFGLESLQLIVELLQLIISDIAILFYGFIVKLHYYVLNL